MSELTTEGSIINDAELKAINTIVKLLSGLDREAQLRVVHYVNGRFPTIRLPAKPTNVEG